MKIDLDIDTIDFNTCYEVIDARKDRTGRACLSNDKNWIYLLFPDVCFYKIQRTYKIVEMLKNRFKVGRKIIVPYDVDGTPLYVIGENEVISSINYWTKQKDLLIEVNEEKAYKLFTSLYNPTFHCYHY